MSEPDLYSILGCSRGCSDGDIKKAYYKLAKTHHPDKNPEMGDKFKEITFAYEVLSNPEKREIYDRHGLEGLQGGGPGAGPHDIFGDLFGGIFGGGSGMGGPFGFGGMGGRGGRMQRRRGEDTMHPLKVSLEDLYNGKTSKLQLSKTVICKKCKGAGCRGQGAGSNSCRACNGRGIKVTLRQLGPGMMQQMQGVCPECRGEGEVIAERDRCKECSGKKVTQEAKVLEVHVDKGMSHNQKIPFRGEGDQAPGQEPGDVIIVIQEKEHEVFTRRGHDLHCTWTLGITEALCGFEFVIKALDGRDLLIKNPRGKVVEPSSVRVVPGEGMPQHRFPTERGNLFIKFEIQFPPLHFASEPNYAKIEALLPKRQRAEIPVGEEVEEVNLSDFDPKAPGGGGGRAAYEEDEEDGGGGHGHGHGHGPGVQCAQQ